MSDIPAVVTSPGMRMPDAGLEPEPTAPARDEQGRFAPSGNEPPAPPPEPVETPPWEGKTPEELWNNNQRLIDENASYKQRYRPWEQATEGLPPEGQEFFRGFLTAIKSGDPTVIRSYSDRMRVELDALSPVEQRAVADAAEEAWNTLDPKEVDARITAKAESLVEARLKAFQAEQQRAAAIERAGQEMTAHARSLGEKYGIEEFGDPDTVEGATLLLAAHKNFADEPDVRLRLDKAAELLVGKWNARGQALLKTKAADAGPSPVPADAVGPSGREKPNTPQDLWDLADRSARERVEKALAGPV